MDNTLQLNQQGGGRIDIPLPENTNVFFCNAALNDIAMVPVSYLTEVTKAPNKRLISNAESTKVNNLYCKYNMYTTKLSSEYTWPESTSYLVNDISSFIKQGGTAGSTIWGDKADIYYLNDTGSTVLNDIPYLEITNCVSYSSASERIYIEGDSIAMCNILIRIRDGYIKLKTLKESYADSPPGDYIKFSLTNESKAIAHDTIPW